MVNENNTAILSPVVNYIQQPAKRVRTQRKHIVKYIHVIDDEGNYIKTQEVYRLSWERKIRYNNIDIYSHDSFKSLRKSFENRDSFYKGIDVEIVSYKERQYSTKRNTRTEVTHTLGRIKLNLPEVHFSYDEDDKEYFRMRSCQYDSTVFPSEICWTQERFRNSHYINNVDTSQAEIDASTGQPIIRKFDENSLYVYLNQKQIKKTLKECISLINAAKAQANYELKANGDIVSIPLKNKMLGRFISKLFGYSMFLFYINTSHGWKYEELTYELIWNLSMYIMQIIKPFGGKEKIDWIEGVTVNKVKYLLARKLFNISNGVDTYLINNVTHFSEIIKEKNMYVVGISSSDKLNFKLSNLSRKQKEILERNLNLKKDKLKKKQAILERNKQIKEMYSKGKSVFLISTLFHISTKRVYTIIKS